MRANGRAKVSADLQGITRTMIWTLRTRADEHIIQDRLFEDPTAHAWFAQVCDQYAMDSWYTPAFQAAIAVRTRLIDDVTREFITTHDSPLIVEMGAGLTTRPYRIDVPGTRWVALDLPEAVAFRSRLDAKSAPIDMIASSVLNYQWLDQLPDTIPENILFIAEGLFMFLAPEECQALVRHMRDRFGGATLLLDMPGHAASFGEAQIARDMDVPLRWMVHDEHDVAALGLSLARVWPFLYQFQDRLRPVLGGQLSAPGARNASLIVEAVVPPLSSPASIRCHDADGQPPPPEPVLFRGRCFAAQKQFFFGQQRLCSPDQTLENIRPFIALAGITRIANITGLDRVGIPVTLVTRPNAPTLSNSTGKGISLEAATISGAMESIEIYLAENARPEEITMPYAELAKEKAIVPQEVLPLAKHSLFDTRLPERWTMGWDVQSQQEVAVPVQLVILNSMREVLGPITNFQMGSNGLASGNHFLEALASALYELIERDAVTTHTYAWQTRHTPPPRIRSGSIRSPLARELLDRFETAGINVILFDMTTDIGIPTYQAIIYDRQARGTGLAGGYGTHLDPQIALIRALTEAAQSRVVGIAGSRDEQFRRHATMFAVSDNAARIKALESIPEMVEGERIATIHKTFEEDIRVILERLRRAGLSQAIVFELSQPGQPISVVRAIVPGLEGYMFQYYTPGPRARAAAVRHTI